METDQEIARREPPAAGLSACLHRSADDGLCSHKIKKNAQLRTQSIPLASSKPVPFAGLLPNGSAHTFSMVPALKTTARKNIMNYVRRGKDSNFLKNRDFMSGENDIFTKKSDGKNYILFLAIGPTKLY